MRFFALSAVIFASILGTSSALVDAGMRTTVDVFGSGYDTRTSGSGCTPDGCMPENTRDNSRDANSRWSCQGDILDDDNNGCWLDYYFDEPQDIVRMRIAFHKGDDNTRTLDVYEDGNYNSTITSSGSTLGYQNFMLDTDETNRIRLRLDDNGDNSDVWLSITEVGQVHSGLVLPSLAMMVSV